MPYYGHNAKIELFDSEEEARAGRAKERHRTQCQLARLIGSDDERLPFQGWYIWVQVGPPIMQAAVHYRLNVYLGPCYRYNMPYYTQQGDLMTLRADQLELLPVLADIPERSFEEWLQAGGEPPPHDIA